ncbi:MULTISPECIES: hypothetical protein [unclassified Mesorhizobium]|uniref:hypothetical protein n=1 Tax=unclassified Mesorhizobium TaxID=325217 RepID=UPI003334CEE6
MLRQLDTANRRKPLAKPGLYVVGIEIQPEFVRDRIGTVFDENSRPLVGKNDRLKRETLMRCERLASRELDDCSAGGVALRFRPDRLGHHLRRPFGTFERAALSDT